MILIDEITAGIGIIKCNKEEILNLFFVIIILWEWKMNKKIYLIIGLIIIPCIIYISFNNKNFSSDNPKNISAEKEKSIITSDNIDTISDDLIKFGFENKPNDSSSYEITGNDINFLVDLDDEKLTIKNQSENKVIYETKLGDSFEEGINSTSYDNIKPYLTNSEFNMYIFNRTWQIVNEETNKNSNVEGYISDQDVKFMESLLKNKFKFMNGSSTSDSVNNMTDYLEYNEETTGISLSYVNNPSYTTRDIGISIPSSELENKQLIVIRIDKKTNNIEIIGESNSELSDEQINSLKESEIINKLLVSINVTFEEFIDKAGKTWTN